jgi:hypothetical protein
VCFSFQNPTVFNYLVDNANIENTVLFADDGEARRIMAKDVFFAIKSQK